MNVSSVPLSSLATSPQTPAMTPVSPQHREVTADNTTVRPGQQTQQQQQQQQTDTTPTVKAAVPPKVGQVIDITA